VLGVQEPARVKPTLAVPLPMFSEGRVDGRTLKPSPLHPDVNISRAIVGGEGASLVFAGGEMVTVRRESLAAALCFDDGALHLLGTDGFHLHLAPEQWRHSKAAFAELERALPPEARVPAGEREKSAWPKVPRWNWYLLAFCLGFFLLGVVTFDGELMAFYGPCSLLAAYPWWKRWYLQAAQRRRK
jgi:hypothetical protein